MPGSTWETDWGPGQTGALASPAGSRQSGELQGWPRTPHPSIGRGPPVAGEPIERALERAAPALGAPAGLEAAHAGVPQVQGHPFIVQAVLALVLCMTASQSCQALARLTTVRQLKPL